MEELIRQGKNVLVIATVSYENGKTASNSYKTLVGLHRLAEQTGRPIPVKIVRNDLIRKDADEEARGFLSEFAFLVSNQHLELDTKDIEHFLNYTKTTSAKPSLVSIECLVNPPHPEEIKYAITVAELHSNSSTPIGLIPSEYSCNGFLRQQTDGVKDGSYYFLITTRNINELVEFLSTEEQNAIRNSLAQTQLDFGKINVGDSKDSLIL